MWEWRKAGMRLKRCNSVKGWKVTHKQEIEYIRACVRWMRGQFYLTSQSARLYGSPGIPDLYLRLWMCTTDALCGWFEVKVGQDKLSEAQARFLSQEASVGRFAAHGTAGDLAEAIVDWLGADGVPAAWKPILSAMLQRESALGRRNREGEDSDAIQQDRPSSQEGC